ncbi:methyltransferase domain-containing protein [Actinoplanes sp. NPDC049265]|uniref:methyltransferase domain-containing protein n=1 Tax=Actinoplanes sp. NPDC049265 TaxID=3363902 RepID=UPI00370FCCF4
MSVFEAVFRCAELAVPAAFLVHGPSGEMTLDPAVWCRDDVPGDATLIEACTGPTLDVGCGPGRLTAALAGAGRVALGIDLSAAAIRLARRRGATVLRRDVFDPLPGTGRWEHVLLADGNIGIGGDPPRLLDRCRRLLTRDGRLHLELAPPGTPTWAGPATATWSRPAPAMAAGPGGARRGAEVAALAWASVAADALDDLAAVSAMRVLRTWTEAGRWFATLTPR